MLTGIIDYGLGNIASVKSAIHKVGARSIIVSTPDALEDCDQLILPGVGAFSDGMNNLHQLGLVEILNELVLEKRKPILGICLGFQLLARSSTEFALTKGLGWIDAEVHRLSPTDPALRIPHMGWNDCSKLREDDLFVDIPQEALFYYVHSFHMVCNDPSNVTGVTDYGQEIVASVRRGNIFGTQFHPEKSQQHGLQLIENFLTLRNP